MRSVLGKLWGLFVDDGALVVLALLWVGIAGWLLPLILSPVTCAALMFVGLAAGLAYSVLRA